MDKRDEKSDRVKRSIEAKMGFFTHLVIYLLVNGVVILPNNFIDGFAFSSLPSVGWGIGVVAHFLKVFVFNSEYVERKVDQIIDNK